MHRPTPVFPLVGSTIQPPGFSSAVALGRFDHRDPNTILDRATGIKIFELREQPHALDGIDPAERDHRRLPDQL
jgi:hypothetical protein